ncbi:DUF6980 family protein [Nocardia otitidiscaviarum]|uniref:DUF6980 family protein n=1 Tax=Nocardia otitidiscaviarum TaxID=1823 RepID=UPI003570BB60
MASGFIRAKAWTLGCPTIVFNYCPWCGAKLPDSLRDEWFDRIFDLGLEGPEDVRIPVDMRTDAWWANPAVARRRSHMIDRLRSARGPPGAGIPRGRVEELARRRSAARRYGCLEAAERPW